MKSIKGLLLELQTVRKIAKRTKKLRHWISSGHIVRKISIQRWIASDKQKILQVGCGPHKIHAAMNADIIDGDIYMDATKKFPIPSNSVDYIFTEQFIEHLSYQEGRFFVSEAYRILNEGGILRQATPSLKGLITVYEGKNDKVDTQDVIKRHKKNHSRNLVETEAQFINDFFRMWNHKFIYDKKTLKKVHKDVGFDEISWKKFGKSEYSALSGLERHADVDWMKEAFLIILEAQK